MKNKILILLVLMININFIFSQTPCNDKQTIAYGGLVYKIKAIGYQCWFTENLNVGKMIPGKNNQTNNNIIEKYCYDNDENNCLTFGALYQLEELMQYNIKEGSTGICPQGWHIPSDNDFNILEKQIGMTQNMIENYGGRAVNQGTKLLSKGETGFDALFGGNRLDDGNFYDQNLAGYFWTSTINENDKNAITRYFLMDSKQIYKDKQNIMKGFSVRCLKD